MATNRVSLLNQRNALLSYFPDGVASPPNQHHLTFTYWAQPSPVGARYKLRLVHRIDESPKVFVLDPKPLTLHPERTRLPHVYSHDEQRLCLYHPKRNQWDASMWHVNTTIEWASEWLFHYEIWVVSGTWNGGGDSHDLESKTAA